MFVIMKNSSIFVLRFEYGIKKVEFKKNLNEELQK